MATATADTQTAAIRRYATETWVQGDLGVIDEVFTADFVRHGPDVEGGPVPGRDGMRQLVTMYRTALPDLSLPVEGPFVGEERAVTRWTAKATNSGPLPWAAPTGRAISVPGIWVHRFEGGQIAEEWVIYDTLLFLQQLGVVAPLPAQGG